MKVYIQRIIGQGADIADDLGDIPRPPLPTLWLLGKTGAGKSSLIRALTGEAEVGSGFAPCTRHAQAFDFPADHPVLRFLDTRGLGEQGYDPDEDLREAERGSHAVVILARLDDPVQGMVAEVLGKLRRARPRLPVVVVHTGADLVAEPGQQRRARAATQATMEEAAGAILPAVTMALPEGAAPQGMGALRGVLVDLLPELSLLLMRERDQTREAAAFATARPMVLWYAGAAGASDLAPLVGAVSVPALQGAMLRALARRYGLEWTRPRIAAFAAALGSGLVLQQAGAHLLRQAVKLVPFVGQSLGAAVAGGVSFAATFALGRAAAFWLFRTARGEPVDTADLRRTFDEAFRKARHDAD
ncbi:YcjF family protein [Alkalilacustris brevis]|uniref:YcjF family protein n=1 Tax=Alkalilacustris brevis TaxID=2026338 RepID=UPI000E0D73A1|nr:GTPase [Alkalilacustris brevis]